MAGVSVPPGEGALPDEFLAALDRFARHERVLIASDFDGVLAPIVLDPTASRPLPGTVETLQAMALLTGVDTAVVSGRDLATLRTLTGSSEGDGVVLIGSHGAETSAATGVGDAVEPAGLNVDERSALKAAREGLEAIIKVVPQARIELKPAGVVLHTRGLPEADAERATEVAIALQSNVPGVHAMRGKAVVELTVLDVSKGMALTALAASVGINAVAYFGDDVTDETVFRAFAESPSAQDGMTQTRHLMVKVGEGETAATYRVADCHLMPVVLQRLHKQLQTRALI